MSDKPRVTIVEDVDCLYVFGEDGERLFVIDDNGSVSPVTLLDACGVDVTYHWHLSLAFDVAMALDRAKFLSEVPEELLKDSQNG